MNEQEMKGHVEEIRRKDDEIYLLNTECEELQEEIGRLKRKVEELEGVINSHNRMGRIDYDRKDT